jgi:hypothetical protein
MLIDKSIMIDKPGVYNITNEQYHASNGVSRSQLMQFKKSPLHYWHEYLSDKPKTEPTEAMTIGSALHMYVMEPELFDKQYFRLEKLDRRTTAGKERYADLIAKNYGKYALSDDSFTTIAAMNNAIKNHAQASSLIENGKIEQSIYWTDQDTGILCKVRPDIWHNNMIVDIKTTSSASYRDFQNSCFKYGYHVQAGMIKEAFKHSLNHNIDSFIFIAVEKDAPYAVAVYVLDNEAIEHGVRVFKSLLTKLKAHKEKNEWPSYETQYLTLPSYLKNEEL